MPDPALLPDDPAVLKQLVVQLLEELQKANARLERQEHHMDLLLKRLYGSTSEKLDPRQGVLFDAQAGRGGGGRQSVPAAARCVAGSQESRQARSRPDSRQDRAEEVDPRPVGGRDGGPGRRGEPGRVAAGAERAARLAALDAVCHRPCPQEIRPQGAAAGERPDAGGAERGGGPQAARGDSRRLWPGRG